MVTYIAVIDYFEEINFYEINFREFFSFFRKSIKNLILKSLKINPYQFLCRISSSFKKQ